MTTKMRQGWRAKLDLRCATERWAYLTGCYNDQLVAAACRLMGQDGLVVDVGANIGLWSVPLARACKANANTRLIAFEPVPCNRARLQENLTLNGLNDVAEVRSVALSDRTGTASISLREEFGAGASTGNAALVIDQTDIDNFRTIQIPLATMDDQLDVEGRRVHVMKIDVEGHEAVALRGAKRMLTASRPVIFAEYNRSYYIRRGVDAASEMDEVLEGLGYTFFRQDGSNWLRTDLFHSSADLDDIVIAPVERADEVARVLANNA